MENFHTTTTRTQKKKSRAAKKKSIWGLTRGEGTALIWSRAETANKTKHKKRLKTKEHRETNKITSALRQRKGRATPAVHHVIMLGKGGVRPEGGLVGGGGGLA